MPDAVDALVLAAAPSRSSVEFGEFARAGDESGSPGFPFGGSGLAGRRLRAAEFFAGIGLVRCGLEQAGIGVVWANDIEPTKQAVYAANFDASDYLLGDIRGVNGQSVPDIDIATAGFPCVDLSLAGHRRGLEGEHSGLFFEFTRVLREMGLRAPPVVMIENVPSFVSSRSGADLRAAVLELNSLGYVCDLLVVDARRFTPQSRPRLFVIGTTRRLAPAGAGKRGGLRPGPVAAFWEANRDLRLQELPLPPLPPRDARLSDVVERLEPGDHRWWGSDRRARFLGSVSPEHRRRLGLLREQPVTRWRTAYRRTRRGAAVWEIRADGIAGCLRTARGGSSRQAVVEAGSDGARVRWMTPREYARLQGAPENFDFSAVTEVQALTGFGDAVCVPVIGWLAEHALRPAAAACMTGAAPAQ